ncbi:MAG: fumarylacetoacetate hydrolase family protein [Planctomycetota bacterium]
MKLARVGPPGQEVPALVDLSGVLRDLRAHVDDIDADTISPTALDRVRALDTSALPPLGPLDATLAPDAPIRLGMPIARPGKIVCVGRNYADHAKEGGAEVPAEPMVFMKATSAACGPFDPIELPPGSTHLDWEVELAVVIGTRAKRVTEADALDHVAGYTILNDVSERHWQRHRSGQFTKGKSHDTFAPLGPVLVTADEVPDPQSLALRTTVDGVTHQDSTTADMVFPVRTLVAHISEFMTLEPGDIIGTGTPAGVAMGQDPPPYLRAGQAVTLEIELLAAQRHEVVAS